jgi:two-component system uhpT operon response regulator UhpA
VGGGTNLERLQKGHGTVKPKVLIVDDNSLVRETTRIYLESKFPALEVNEAIDGNDAFNQIRRHLPDLILMDIRLPGENGLKLTRRIKELYPQIVVVIFTSYDLPEYRKAAFENGAALFFSKSSLHNRKLMGAIDAILADYEFNMDLDESE